MAYRKSLPAIGTSALVGLFSGLISFFAYSSFKDSAQYLLLFLPGGIFGLAIGIYFIITYKPTHPLLRLVLFIIIAEVGFIAAENVTVASLFFLPFLSLMIGGMVGTFAMLLGLYLAFRHLTLVDFITTTLIGGLLGFSALLIPSGSIFTSSSANWGPAPEQYLSLYIFWQTGMAAIIGLLFNGKNRGTQLLKRRF